MPNPIALKMGKLGFGVAGPLASRLFSSSQCQQLIETAIETGVRFFDTGPSYGGGEGERRLGKVLTRTDRSKLFISTKAGITERGMRDFSPRSLYDSLFRSLDRMQVDYVDGLFLHGLTRSDFNDEFLKTLEQLQAQKVVKHLGVVGQSKVMKFIVCDHPQFALLMMQLGPQHIPTNMPVAKAAQQAGRTVIGIEMLAHTRKAFRFSARRGDLWHMARYLRRGGKYRNQDPRQVLKSALELSDVDVVLTSSTKCQHVEEWPSCLDEPSSSS